METSSICISMPSCRKITSKKLITLGLSTVATMRRPAISKGEITWFAPARSSLLSVPSSLARTTICRFGLSWRAGRVTNTFCGSSCRALTKPFARSMPACSGPRRWSHRPLQRSRRSRVGSQPALCWNLRRRRGRFRREILARFPARLLYSHIGCNGL